jgi:hypothetical protein
MRTCAVVCGSVAVYGIAHISVRAVRAAVCGSAAVCVNGSVRGIVRLYGCLVVRQCAASQ